jgi:serine protease inhibitor
MRPCISGRLILIRFGITCDFVSIHKVISINGFFKYYIIKKIKKRAGEKKNLFICNSFLFKIVKLPRFFGLLTRAESNLTHCTGELIE